MKLKSLFIAKCSYKMANFTLWKLENLYKLFKKNIDHIQSQFQEIR